MKKLVLMRIEKAQVVKDLHTKVKQHIEKLNKQYALKANKRRKKGGLSAYEEK
jgi:hypothetical protein